MTDKLLRMLTLLEQIPRAPYKRTPRELRAALAAIGYETEVRSVQRDLHLLSRQFPLEADQRSKPFGWHWSASAHAHTLPRMNPAEALGYRLLSQYLDKLLPQPVLASLKPQMEAAERVLETLPGGGFKDWANKVRILAPGQALLPPTIESAALAKLYEALLTNRRIRAHYRKVAERQPWLYKELSPLALVLRGQVIYFLCTVADYADVLQFAAHRFRKVEILSRPVNRPPGFDLNRYIEENGFDFASGKTIHLKLRVRQFLAVILEETPLSKDQTIKATDDDWSSLAATVADTEQLRWWLLSFGRNAVVMRPLSLRKDMAGIYQDMAKLYHS